MKKWLALALALALAAAAGCAGRPATLDMAPERPQQETAAVRMNTSACDVNSPADMK